MGGSDRDREISLFVCVVIHVGRGKGRASRGDEGKSLNVVRSRVGELCPLSSTRPLASISPCAYSSPS